MRRSAVLTGGLFWLATLIAISLGPAIAQQPVTVPASTRTTDISELLRQGQEFEVQRRWGDALSHYEGALRQFPGESGFQRRFEFARMHYDLQRRYNDCTFCDSIARLSATRAMELYSEVLLKIQTHYVEVPRWKELVERGTNDMEIAIGEPTFVARNLPTQERGTVDQFRQELRRVLGPRPINSRDDARTAVALAAQLAEQRLALSPAVTVLEYLCGAANTLDPYSAYLTPEQLNEVYAQIEGNFVGLGIELKAQDAGLLIVRVITGSPAQQSGILAGDRIMAVNGRATREMTTDQAANLLQGEADSLVELSVQTASQEPRNLTIRRRRVEVPSIDQVKILDPEYGVAYLQLTCFQKATSRDLDAALWKLHRDGMRTLIMDLRGNPGGLLVSAVEVADKFLEHGIIVSTRGRSVQEDFTYTARPEGTWRVPLVVLIDQDSASAAEIFAGAIRDHRRGTVVGVRSYGKGSVQGIFPLTYTTAGIRLTTAKFYSPNGRPYSGVGVEPDVMVHSAARPVAPGTASPEADPMLSAALDVARGRGRQVQQAQNLR